MDDSAACSPVEQPSPDWPFSLYLSLLSIVLSGLHSKLLMNRGTTILGDILGDILISPLLTLVGDRSGSCHICLRIPLYAVMQLGKSIVSHVGFEHKIHTAISATE